MATAIARHCKARYIVVTDINPYRLKLAERMGATLTINPKTTSIAQVQKELGMKEGFDVGMEMSGSPDAFRSMLDNMCHGGKIAMLGILPKTEIDWDEVVFNGLTIKGIYGREMYETWYKMTMMIQCGLDITPVITHRFHYTEFQKGFELMRSGQSGKIILSWEQD
jgi:threonine 3-dehydrogenase